LDHAADATSDTLMVLDVFGSVEQRRPLMIARPRPRTGYPRKWIGTFFLTGLLTALLGPSSAFAVSRYVWPDGSGLPPCEDPFDPCPLIEFALSAANAGDRIILATGTYLERGLTISQPLTIEGATMDTSIIDAGLKHRHFTITAGGTVVIRDLTLTNGTVTGFDEGGALLVTQGGTLEVVNTKITDSHAFGGGAISCDGCKSLEIRKSILKNNTADKGGAINTDADTLVADSTIANNTAAVAGGGIYKERNELTVRDSEIVENGAEGGDGGGIFSAQDKTKIVRSAFIKNSALGNGGGVSVHGFGLGPDNELLILNTTFSANTASSGGAIDVGTNNTAPLGNLTMVDNLATTAGEANDIKFASANITVTLSNSILTHPAGSTNPECGSGGGAMTGSNNLIDTDMSCLGAAGFRLGQIAAAALGPLNFHGGRTRNYSIIPAGGGADDPVDAVMGNCLNPLTGAPINQDQKWKARPNPNTGECDIGSVELY
jgi:hypothetical protein